MDKLMLDVDVQDKLQGEVPSLFHVLKRLKRRKSREIRVIRDRQGNTYTRPHDIQDIFVTHLAQKEGPIEVEDTSIAVMEISHS
jgi:hypothetical protein